MGKVGREEEKRAHSVRRGPAETRSTLPLEVHCLEGTGGSERKSQTRKREDERVTVLYPTGPF